MSKIDTNNSNFNLDYIADELFTELTSERAEVIQGGSIYISEIDFDVRVTTKEEFFVPAGGFISLTTITENSSDKFNPFFSATIFNKDTKGDNKKTVSVGIDQTIWTGLREGHYKIIFTDSGNRDGNNVKGGIIVSYTTS